MTETNKLAGEDLARSLMRQHFRFGWWSLLIFVMLGSALDIMHGFKIGFYLNVSNETRRLMWVLSHRHGTLLALVNIAFALTIQHLPDLRSRLRTLASPFLMAATILMPAGFFLGGFYLHGGDPGLGILLVPLGAVFLITSVLLIAIEAIHACPAKASSDGDGGAGGKKIKPRRKG